MQMINVIVIVIVIDSYCMRTTTEPRYIPWNFVWLSLTVGKNNLRLLRPPPHPPKKEKLFHWKERKHFIVHK